MFISVCIGTPIKVLYFDMNILSLSHLSGLIIKSVFEGPLLLGITMIMGLRVWSLNFNHKLQLELANDSWKSQLSSFTVNPKSFYTKYKNTLGSLSWSLKTFGSIYILLCTLFIITDFLFHDIYLHSIATGILITGYVITISIITIIWVKYPKFKDNMFIRNELKESIIYIIIIIIIGFVLLFFIRIVFTHINGLDTLTQFTEILLMNGLLYLCILRVIKLNAHKKDIANNNPASTKLYMNTILENKHGYAEFMNFLVQEWSSENLCFATEYSQFRESLNLNDKQKTLMGCNVTFSTAISNRKSQFQCDTALDCQQFIAIINKLYNKYIAFDISTYEINVSYSARLSLAVLIDDKYKQYVVNNRDNNIDLQDIKTNNLPKNNLPQTIQIIIPLLEVILFEVTRLLQNAFSRFKRTEIWNELCNQIINENNGKSMELQIISASQKTQSSVNLFGDIARKASNYHKDINRNSVNISSVGNDSPISAPTDNDNNINTDFPVTNRDIYNSISNASSPSPGIDEPLELVIEPDFINDQNVMIDLMRVPTHSVVSKDAIFVE